MKAAIITILIAICLTHLILYYGFGTGIFRGIIYPVGRWLKSMLRYVLWVRRYNSMHQKDEKGEALRLSYAVVIFNILQITWRDCWSDKAGKLEFHKPTTL